MKHIALRVASGPFDYEADHAAMNVALSRLHGATADQVSEIASKLGARERAALAVFCYSRAHLNSIGLALAAQCSVDHLSAAAGSSVAGRTLYAQSRELPPVLPVSHRRSITLATSAQFAFTPRFVSDEANATDNTPTCSWN